MFIHYPPDNLFSFNKKQRLAVLDRLRVFDQHFANHAVNVGADLVHQLHRLDDANCLPDGDLLAFFDEWFGTGGRRAVKRADHRRGNLFQV